MKIYLDVDDTLADFKRYAQERGVPPWTGTWYTTDPKTWTPEMKRIDQITRELMEAEDFWPKIPLAPGAFEMIAAASLRAETYLLTALPRFVNPDLLPRIKEQKIEYAARRLHFPTERVIVCNRPEKINYAMGGYMDIRGAWNPTPNLLVDDAEQNCEEWRAHGGIAIHYTGNASVLDEIKAVLL